VRANEYVSVNEISSGDIAAITGLKYLFQLNIKERHRQGIH